jgi:hypothetical protein
MSLESLVYSASFLSSSSVAGCVFFEMGARGFQWSFPMPSWTSAGLVVGEEPLGVVLSAWSVMIRISLGLDSKPLPAPLPIFSVATSLESFTIFPISISWTEF